MIIKNCLFRLVNPDNHGLNAPTIGFGSLGSQGFAPYAEVCEFLRQPRSGLQWDEESKVPYAYNGFDWISYDNEDSVQEKVSNISQLMLFLWRYNHFLFS